MIKIFASQKRRFLLIGIFNVLLCNLILQLLLFFFSVRVSTLLSQISSNILGYIFYKNFVFICNSNKLKSLTLFTLLAIFLWTTNWIGISYGISIGINKFIAAIFMIPALASISYLSQRYLIFKNY